MSGTVGKGKASIVKKLAITVAGAMLLLTLLVPGAGAADVGVKHTAEVDSLNKLQLFQGTDRGYELDQTLTRAQGATMLQKLVEDDRAVSVEAAVGSGLYKKPSSDPLDQIESAIRDALK